MNHVPGRSHAPGVHCLVSIPKSTVWPQVDEYREHNGKVVIITSAPLDGSIMHCTCCGTAVRMQIGSNEKAWQVKDKTGNDLQIFGMLANHYLKERTFLQKHLIPLGDDTLLLDEQVAEKLKDALTERRLLAATKQFNND